MLSWFKGLLFVTPFLFMQGCGYTLNHRLKDTFAYGHGIFVPVFTNKTDETGAEIVFTNAFIRELQSHGETLSNHKDDSGLQIDGTVTDITFTVEAFSPSGYTGNHGAQYTTGLQAYDRIPDQVGVHVTILVNVLDPKDHKQKWAKTFTGYRRVSAPLNRVSDQDAPSSVGMMAQSVYEASYSDIARDIMHDVYDQMIEF